VSDGWKGPLKQIDECRWDIPVGYKAGMRTSGRIYATADMIPEIVADKALEQVANVACLPGIVGRSMAMPDIHLGYGFAIGGVAAFDTQDGIISPGGVGYDINCGMRLLRTNLTLADVGPHLTALMDDLYESVPAGLGSEGPIKVSRSDLATVLVRGAAWAVEQEYGWPEDLGRLEEHGALAGADPKDVSSEAVKRGLRQLGTLGSGNHFVEVQVIEDIWDEKLARAFGLAKDQVVIMLHSGSRGFGHQVCTDYLARMDPGAKGKGGASGGPGGGLPGGRLVLPDRQLACAPLGSEAGRSYFAAMAGAANYAWANRTCLSHWVRAAFARRFGCTARQLEMDVVYDVAHNMAKFERHMLTGKGGETREVTLCVHRKGATRALAAGHPEIVEAYRASGQPVLIPGNMGTHSYVLVGTEQALAETFGSTCHGAGRRLSRSAAKRLVRGSELKRELGLRGIEIRSGSEAGLAEEAPAAYKDVDQVVGAAEKAGLSRRVARMRPLGVLKG
jgi:tRNA-splicing ligase RtcB